MKQIYPTASPEGCLLFENVKFKADRRILSTVRLGSSGYAKRLKTRDSVPYAKSTQLKRIVGWLKIEAVTEHFEGFPQLPLEALDSNANYKTVPELRRALQKCYKDFDERCHLSVIYFTVLP